MKLLKKIGIVFLVLIVIGAIGNVMGGTKKSEDSSGTESADSKPAAGSAADSFAESVTAEQTAAAPASEPAGKAQRNGFDEAENQTYEYQGFAFSMPAYLTAVQGEGGTVIFNFNGETQGTIAVRLRRSEVRGSVEEFESAKAEMLNNLVKDTNVSWQSSSPVTIAGCSGIMGTYEAIGDAGHEEMDAYMWYDANNGAVLVLDYIETSQATYTYSDDIKKIVASATYTGGGITSEAAPETPEETAGADDTDVPAGVTPEFKEQMDQYEAFFDEYVEFMRVYSESDNPVELMSQYIEIMHKYNEYMAAIDAIDEAELSDADALYFAQVNLRIEEKLLNVTASLY